MRADASLASRLALVETTAALAAARRAGRLSGVGVRRARAQLAERWRELVGVDLDARLTQHAANLAAAHVLSGGDAVHLATALGTADVLVTWDARLAQAARDEGVAVAPASYDS
jgi:predicted nucleic acid-binding protein